MMRMRRIEEEWESKNTCIQFRINLCTTFNFHSYTLILITRRETCELGRMR